MSKKSLPILYSILNFFPQSIIIPILVQRFYDPVKLCCRLAKSEFFQQACCNICKNKIWLFQSENFVVYFLFFKSVFGFFKTKKSSQKYYLTLRIYAQYQNEQDFIHSVIWVFLNALTPGMSQVAFIVYLYTTPSPSQ